MIPITLYIKKTANTSIVEYFKLKLREKYGLDTIIKPDVHEVPNLLRQIYNIFNSVPPKLINDCGIKTIILRNDLGVNRPYYPNHGYYCGSNRSITLNADIFYHPDLPDDFFDHHGYFLTRPIQTLLHELGHGFDEYHSNLSLQDKWLKLSGWSENFKPGLKRLIINDERAPRVIGEWFFDPKAEFTRFYAKRNPWDDFADSFAFFTGNIRNKVPEQKCGYFNKHLKKYY